MSAPEVWRELSARPLMVVLFCGGREDDATSTIPAAATNSSSLLDIRERPPGPFGQFSAAAAAYVIFRLQDTAWSGCQALSLTPITALCIRAEEQVVQLHVQPGEVVLAEPGCFCYCSSGVEMDTRPRDGFLGGINRMLAGENFFTNQVYHPLREVERADR